MKPANVKHLKFLKALRAKTAGVHQAVTAAQILPVLDDMILNLEDVGGEDARTQAYGELLAGARAGDRAMSAEVSTIRSIRVDNFLRAKNNALAFLDLVVLGPAEVPYITNTSRMEIDVAYSGQDGRVRKTQGIKYQEDAQCSLFLLSSAEFEYPLKDMLRGSVADETKTLVDIAYDLDRKIDTKLWPLITGRCAAFTLSGSRAARTYVAHSAINANNLPTTNVLAGPSLTTSTHFNKDCLDVVADYVAAFADTLPGGALMPVAVFIPSKHSMGWLRSITMTSQPNTLVEQVINTGVPLHYAGRDWLFIPDATLDPNAGLAYVQMNAPVGTFFNKPFMDAMESKEDVTANKGSMKMAKAIGYGFPSTQAVNICSVSYRTAV